MLKMKKIKAISGETLVETLVTILISALALMVLATVIATSVRLVDQSRAHMDEFYKAESDLPGAGSINQTLVLEVPLEKGTNEINVEMSTTGNETGIVYYDERSVTP